MVWYNPTTWFDSGQVESEQSRQVDANAINPPSPEWGWWAGDKYHGGFGPTQLYAVDYYTLQERSGQLFRENIYARGLIRRFVTNEINTGLSLECIPDADILGIDEETLADWSENTENRFAIYARNPELCDWERRRTYGQIQRELRQESLIDGDMLVVLHQSARYKLPQIQLISGKNVQSPLTAEPKNGNSIEYGVERDKDGRHVAYHVLQEDNSTVRIPAFGRNSGRRIAWLVYGTDKRMGDVRGEPLLSIILQSLKEIDRYRDAALRKATINSILAMFIEKNEERMGTNPISGGAVRKDQVTPVDDTNTERRFNVTQHIPGMVIEELQVGEKPTPHSTAGTDVNFGPFESAVIAAIAWVHETPPEILKLSFSSNYSASAAAINEYRMYLNLQRMKFGETVCSPIYVEWLLSEILLNKLDAPGFLEAWNNASQYDIYGAWIASDWTGAIKPATDLVKQTKGYQTLVQEGWITNERAARELTGTKWRKNIKRIMRENELKKEANGILTPEIAEPTAEPTQEAQILNLVEAVDELADRIEEAGSE